MFWAILLLVASPAFAQTPTLSLHCELNWARLDEQGPILGHSLMLPLTLIRKSAEQVARNRESAIPPPDRVAYRSSTELRLGSGEGVPSIRFQTEATWEAPRGDRPERFRLNLGATGATIESAQFDLSGSEQAEAPVRIQLEGQPHVNLVIRCRTTQTGAGAQVVEAAHRASVLKGEVDARIVPASRLGERSSSLRKRRPPSPEVPSGRATAGSTAGRATE